MSEITTAEIKEYLAKIQGKQISLKDLRAEFNILPGTKSFDAIRNIMFQLTEQKIVKFTGKKDGTYKVIKQVKPVPIFSVKRERRPPVELIFPKDFNTGMEMEFAQHIVFREGDLITIGGVKSKGKTTLCMLICAENIDKSPVLMGNEYTVLVGENGIEDYAPAPRFLHRLDKMSEWVTWVDEEGNDKLTVLPVRDDYVEHVVKDKINIIDWINMDANALYDIGKVLEGIKANLGRGIGIVALQKSESADNPRGGQFVRDFSDVELLLDGYGKGEDEILLTVKGAKEKKKPIVGKTYAYSIIDGGTKIVDFREVKKCPSCFGRGFGKAGECENCYGKKYTNV